MRRSILALAVIAPISIAHAEQTVEADNGGVYRIDQIAHDIHGGAEALVYGPSAPGDIVAPVDLVFDCHGQ